MEPVTLTGRVISHLEGSTFFQGALTAGVIFTIVLVALAVCASATYLLKRFFTRTPWITRAHRITIYLLTMTGVVFLVLAGLLGFVLPLIPGFLLILLALLLLRRYYRNKWVDKNIRWLQFKLRLKRGVKRIKHHLRKSGKHLRGRKNRPKPTGEEL